MRTGALFLAGIATGLLSLCPAGTIVQTRTVSTTTTEDIAPQEASAPAGAPATTSPEQLQNADKHDNIPIAKVPDVPPPSREALEVSFRKAASFLIPRQNKDGSWGDHTGTKGLNVLCPYPQGPRSFRLASTALCVVGLSSSPLHDDPAVRNAVDKALDVLIRELPKLKRGDTITLLSTWAHAYGLEAYCSAAKRLPKDSPRFLQLKEAAARAIHATDLLSDEAYGGWGYYTFNVFSEKTIGMPTSFLTATVLLGYKDAKDVFGLESDPNVLKRALKILKAMRTPSGTFVYSRDHMFHGTLPINRHTGSLARNPAGDMAIMSFEPETVALTQLEDNVERLWSREGWLSMALKKPVPHESFAQNAGYFFYYGYYYAARTFDWLPKENLPRHAAQLSSDILHLQEKDGCWWDYPLYNYHKFYGTGYALYSMSRVWDTLQGGTIPLGEESTPGATIAEPAPSPAS